MPNFTQQPVLEFYPRPVVRNVPQDPITQHTDQRAKPRVYESLIKPVPVDVQLQGTLPPYDVDKVWEEYDWTPPKDQDQEGNLCLSMFQIIRYLGHISQKQLSLRNL